VVERDVVAWDEAAPPPGSAVERELVDGLARALEDRDVRALVALLSEDVWLTMPPVPLEYQGRELAGRFFATVAFAHGRRYRLVETRANGQPAFGVYVRDPHAALARANGLLVLGLRGDRVAALTRFDPGVMAWFGLPRTLPDG
jgi:RNA polymerase sigma-70 factor, ECF subfamily